MVVDQELSARPDGQPYNLPGQPSPVFLIVTGPLGKRSHFCFVCQQRAALVTQTSATASTNSNHVAYIVTIPITSTKLFQECMKESVLNQGVWSNTCWRKEKKGKTWYQSSVLDWYFWGFGCMFKFSNLRVCQFLHCQHYHKTDSHSVWFKLFLVML